MAIFTDFAFIDICLVLIPLGYLIFKYIQYKYSYWDRKGIPNVKTESFYGAIRGTKSNQDTLKEMYENFPNEKFIGFYQFMVPSLMIKDSELINRVLVKDFVHFQDRWIVNFKKDILSESLPALRGQTWKALRNKLTPTFTTGKLKGMFEQLSKSGDNMIDKIDQLVTENSSGIDCKTFLFEFTLDVIASCAFGLQFKPNSPEFNKFKAAVQKMFNPSVLALLKMGVASISTTLVEYFNITQNSKEVCEYFSTLTKANIKYRTENNIKRNDYFQVLLTLKEREESGKDYCLTDPDENEDDTVINQMQYTVSISDQPVNSHMNLMTDDSLCANTFIFLAAGSESVANAISTSLFLVAQHPDVQQRLQHEVDSAIVQHKGWNYNAVKQMTYLDQVIQESQRMYPLVPLLLRECVIPYKVPGTNFTIEKGTLIGVPIIGLHYDPQYYSDPMTFNPDRFEGNNHKPNAAYMPFGDGPRICIAMRFAVLEVKVCMARIIAEYIIKISPKMQLPIKFNIKSQFPSVEGGILLDFERRTK